MTTQILAYGWASVPSDPGTWAINRLVSVASARPEAASHNTAVLNNAISTLGSSGEIELPPGLFHVNHRQVLVDRGPIRLIGQGYDEIMPGTDNSRGTCLVAPEDQGGTALVVTGTAARGFRMSGIGFRQDITVPTSGAWRPDYGLKEFAVEIENTAGRVHIEDVFFPRALKGLRVRGTGTNSVGRIRIDSIKGDAIHRLLEMDRVLDASSVGEVHAWPLSSPAPGVWTEAQGALLAAVSLGRVDGLQVDRLLAFNAAFGIHSTNLGSGVARFVHFDQVYADFCKYGIFADGGNEPAGTNLNMTVDSFVHQGENFQVGGGIPLVGGFPLLLRNGAYVAIGHMHAERLHTHLVVVDQGAARALIGSCRVQLGGGGQTVTSLTAGASVKFSQIPDLEGSHIGWRQGGVGSVTLPTAVEV